MRRSARPDRQRHQLGGLVARVAEHHSLIASTLQVEVVTAGARTHLLALVDTLRDVGALRIERHEHTTGLGIEAEFGVGIADVLDDSASNLGDVDIGVGRDLAGHQAQPRGHERLARHARLGILREDGVEHRVGHLIGDLVGVSFGDALRGERVVTAHDFSGLCDGDVWAARRSRPLTASTHDLVEQHPGHGPLVAQRQRL